MHPHMQRLVAIAETPPVMPEFRSSTIQADATERRFLCVLPHRSAFTLHTSNEPADACPQTGHYTAASKGGRQTQIIRQPAR
jgi:hypothetical protein